MQNEVLSQGLATFCGEGEEDVSFDIYNLLKSFFKNRKRGLTIESRVRITLSLGGDAENRKRS
jgi:hypothetical protein